MSGRDRNEFDTMQHSPEQRTTRSAKMLLWRRPGPRVLGAVLLFSPLVYLGVCAALGVALSESTLRLPAQHVYLGKMFALRMTRQFGAHVEPASVTAADGAVLRGWWVMPPEPNGRAVVLLHGIGGNRVDMSGYADIFLAKGYDVLLPDSRGHGESGGRVATFGLLESDDVRRWAAWVQTRATGCTYLLGESMGAAIALEATAVTPSLCAVAVEDPYSQFRSLVYERLGHDTGLGTRFWRTVGWPVVQAAITWTHLRYRIWLPDAAPAKAIRRSEVPVLLMTGTADDLVPMHHAVDLEQACGTGRCALWVVPGALHGGISTVTGAEFGRRLLLWFAMHDRPDARPIMPEENGEHRLRQAARLVLPGK